MELKQGQDKSLPMRQAFLLIVPCGIETLHQVPHKATTMCLLIVPCGIETVEGQQEHVARQPFNRTLWN